MSVQAQVAETIVDKPTPGAEANPNPEAADAAQDVADESGWDDKTKAYIKKLRDESAKHRTKAKEFETQIGTLNTKFDGLQKGLKTALGIEEEGESPEEKIAMLQHTSEAAVFESAVLNIALENQIPADKVAYLKFLISEKAGSLEENQEVDEEMLKAIIDDVKAIAGKPKSSKTSVDGKTPPPENGGASATTVEQFAKMSLTEKSQLFQKNPKQYDELMASALSKKLI